MGLFDKMKEPIFLKETGSSNEQLEGLKALLPDAPQEIQVQIERDIKLLSAGMYGEEQIAFELKNSHMPMFILHDLFLTDGDLSAQIDYLVITRKRNFVIECKNLFGNIEINNNGDFIRTVYYNGRYNKEGIYSPITQNQRHLELIKKILRESKSNFIIKALFERFERFFYDTYRTVVVLANPKTVLNAKYAKKEIKEQVIRADQLVDHIKQINSQRGCDTSSEKDTEELARYFLSLHRGNPADYIEKYRTQIAEYREKSEPTAKLKLQKKSLLQKQ
jgi:transposase-like protein